MSTRTRGKRRSSTNTLFSQVAKPTVKPTKVTPTKTVWIQQVSAGYEWETEYERVINRRKATINDPELADHIAWECYANTKDPKLCVKNMIWVSNSETTMFRSCSRGNNCFGVMQRQSDWSYKLRTYESKKASISAWVELYNRLGWYNRTTAQARLDGNYCTSVCATRIQNYNYAVLLLWI